MRRAEPDVPQRFPPPTWGGIGWGVDDQVGDQDVAVAFTLTIDELLRGTGGALRGAPGLREVAGVSIDSRTIEPGQVFFAIAGPRFDGHDFLAEAAAKGALAAVVHREPKAPPALPIVRVADTTRALGDLARHVRRAAGLPVVGITGSVGKTTTKEMTAALLATRGPVLKTEGNLNNAYGLPLTLLRLRPEHTAAVLELGMSAPGELLRWRPSTSSSSLLSTPSPRPRRRCWTGCPREGWRS
ncbi:MAG: hypothetical protein DMF79_04635 [Acidobacteria bacterium]|nr:MAG: hypothetical protein DMF79_04635 [Acidobacteriota bacterium]